MKIQDVISVGETHLDVLQVNWEITNHCQLRCEYCYAMNFITKDIIINDSWKKVIRLLGMSKAPFVMHVIGGEPTNHPHFFEAMEGLCDIELCKAVEISTNFAYDATLWEKFNHEKFKKLDIQFSYHPQYNLKFIEKLDIIKNYEHLQFSFNIMLSPKEKYYAKTEALIEELNRKGYTFSLNILTDTSNNFLIDQYDTSFKIYLDRLYERFQKGLVNGKYLYTDKFGNSEYLDYAQIGLRELNNLNGFKCLPAFYTIDVYGNLFNMCTKNKVLFLSKKLLENPIVCPLQSCNCEFLYGTKKWRN